MKKIVSLLTLVTFILCIGKIKSYTKYNVGDIVPYNGMNFYVIKNSSSNDDTVTLLKAEPLTVDEVNLYGGVGTEDNHVNMFNASSNDSYYRKASNQNGYGGMAYYTSIDCGYGFDSNHTKLGCTTDYEESEIKYVVDAWKSAEVPVALDARLITLNDLTTDLGYVLDEAATSMKYIPSLLTPTWAYNSSYWYWTSTSRDDSMMIVWYMDLKGDIVSLDVDGTLNGSGNVASNSGVIRPVIVLNKTTLGYPDESIVDNSEQSSKNDANESKTTVKVANTYMSSSIIIIILGFIIASVSVFVLYKVRNKNIK